jgi:hypothetical protein
MGHIGHSWQLERREIFLHQKQKLSEIIVHSELWSQKWKYVHAAGDRPVGQLTTTTKMQRRYSKQMMCRLEQ